MTSLRAGWWLAGLAWITATRGAAQDTEPADARSLAGQLGKDPHHDVEILARLRALGPSAGDVLPEVLAAPTRREPACHRAWVETLGELVPYRPAAVELDVSELRHRDQRDPRLREPLDPELQAAWWRLEMRGRFPRDADVAALAQITRGYAAHRVELALELLAPMGGRARPALPP